MGEELKEGKKDPSNLALRLRAVIGVGERSDVCCVFEDGGAMAHWVGRATGIGVEGRRLGRKYRAHHGLRKEYGEAPGKRFEGKLVILSFL